jgi:hypothetical protein
MKLFANEFVEVRYSPFAFVVSAGIKDLDSLKEVLVAVGGVVLLKQDPKVC